MAMGALEGQLEFVDALKPDITSYLATETTGNLTTSSELGHLNLASWLTPKRLLCYFRPFEEHKPHETVDEARSIFGAPPSPGSLHWPARPNSHHLDALGRAEPPCEATPTANGSDSGSESARSTDTTSRSRRREVAKCQKAVGPGSPGMEELLEFTSCFESGNLRCALYDKESDEYLLFLDHDLHSRGHTQWFYFAVRNAKAGRVYRLRIVNMSKPKALFRVGMRPVAWSELDAKRRLFASKKCFEDSVWDGAAGLWKPVGEDVRYYRTGSDSNISTLSFDYVFERGHDCVFFAYYVPYTYSMLRWTLNHLVRDPATRSFCQLKRLAATVGQARCDMLTITNSCIDRKTKKVVIVSARVHPGESNASWLVHGLIGFLLSSTAEAQVLRDNFVWICVPMLNPDGVICGNYRCGLCGTDLNRQWKQPHEVLHSSVHKLKKLVSKSKSKLSMYLDLHGHSRKCGIFAYACGQFAEDDHRRFTVRIYPKLLSVLIPEFNFFHCRWSVGKGKRGTGRVVTAKDLGITNAYTIEVSMWGAVDVGPVASKASSDAEMEEEVTTVIPFSPSKLQVMGANLARALIVQHSLGPMVQARLRNSRAWDGGKGGPWPALMSEKELFFGVQKEPIQMCQTFLTKQENLETIEVCTLPLQKELIAEESAALRASSASPCNSDSTSSGSDVGSDNEKTKDLPFEEDTSETLKDSLRPNFQSEGSLKFLNINVSDLVDELDVPDGDESDTGGSDSDPSDDNLELSELRQVEEKLLSRKPNHRSLSKRKASRRTKRLNKVPSKKDVQSSTHAAHFPTSHAPCNVPVTAPAAPSAHSAGARQRAKSFGRKENEEMKEKVDKSERVSLQDSREVPRPLEKVVAFGGTTYLAGRRGGSCMPRLQEKETRSDPLESAVSSKDRLDRLHRRSMGTMGTTSNLTNPRVQLAAACVLQGRLETQDSLKSESSLQLPSPRGDVNGSVNNVCTVNPRGLRFEGESERPFLRKSRPKTATARRDGRDPRDAPRSESEHVRRCSDRPQWDGPRVQVDKDAPPDEMALSPSTVRSSGTRTFASRPPAIGDKIAMAALRSWAVTATALAKANLEQDRESSRQ
ncbi:unnamed protein product [Durusdinium trenchii]|uniref:Peptidase M14 domain-containing protein n=1 Tax=Durusdinium trenchii TaxID=1381693 RepID=A0ABP0SXL8_9DINO